MFRFLGLLASRFWVLLLILWFGGLVVVQYTTPSPRDVTQSGEFKFLPEDAPTRQGEKLFKKAFENDLLGSSIVLILHRTDEQPLTPQEFDFIELELKPRLQALIPAGASPEDEEALDEETSAPITRRDRSTADSTTFPEIERIRTPGSREIGKLLVNDQGLAALTIIDLNSDFMSYAIRYPVRAVEKVLAEIEQQNLVPEGLEISLSGSALVGRDIADAQKNSADAIEFWTLILIVTLLFAVYRAPLPVLIPLVTLFIAMKISLRLLAAAAQAGWIDLFEGFEVYTTVVAYGAGVDFSMFLTSRYHEEIRKTESPQKAIINTMIGVGPAVAAAAGTVIFGIAMMTFARFGKFHQAGISISFALFMILLAALTFTPAMLRMMGRWTFWPELPGHAGEEETLHAGFLTHWIRRITLQERVHQFWVKLGEQIITHPVRYWTVTVLAMLPFAVLGTWHYESVSFDLVRQLNKNSPSVLGTQEIARHFSPGLTGPVTVVIEQTELNFAARQGRDAVQTLIQSLVDQQEELNISDIRSVIHPLGLYHQFEQPRQSSSTFSRILRRGAERTSTRDYYVGEKTETGSHATRLDIIMNADPFSRDSIEKLNRLETAVRQKLPPDLQSATVHFIGSTANIRDLQTIAGGDRFRINALVTIAVFVVLLILIRDFYDSLYLMVSVIFSFLCTLGVAWLLFWSLDPTGFDGLDWTVPLFLFTILIAVGQDYNIFLITRVHEERQYHGPLGSIQHAIVQTAAIITSCGIIMAGTFSSMILGGQLARMTQLGFSLAFGVLLDTFVVRPILVPAYLAWRAKRQLQREEEQSAQQPEVVSGG